MVPCAITHDPMIPKPFPTMVMCNTCVIPCNTSVHYLGYLTSKYEHKICVWAACRNSCSQESNMDGMNATGLRVHVYSQCNRKQHKTQWKKGYKMKEASAQVQHGRFDHHQQLDERTLCTNSPRNKRLLYSASSCGMWRSQHGRFNNHRRFDEPTLCTSSKHATNDFCIAPRLAESGAHSMDTSFSRQFPIIARPTRVWTRVDHHHATNDFCIAPRLAESGAHSMDGLMTMAGLMTMDLVHSFSTPQTTFV